MNNSGIHWQFADENTRQRLGKDPLARFAGAECVKSNPVRQVFRIPGLYLKMDKRGRSFSGEFRAAWKMKSYGIPAVSHLACGTDGKCAALITEEAAGFRDLNHLADFPAEAKFLENFAGFIRTILAVPVFHPDFHLGNILYQPDSGKFLLIDLHGVRRRTLFDTLFSMHRMYRILLEWREGVPDAELTGLLELAGVPRAEKFLPEQLKREAAQLKHEFPRRVRQILSGYAKFTRKDERGLLAAATAAVPEAPTPCRESEEIFLLHFFLKLARIPHNGIAGITPDGKGFYRGVESPFRLPPEDLKKRLLFYNLEVPDALLDSGVLADLRPVLENNRKVFLSYAR